MLLREVLKTKGVKQKWLATKLGVSEVTVSNWIKGKSQPSSRNLKKMSEVLAIPLRELMNE